jgi:hypothetical protein
VKWAIEICRAFPEVFHAEIGIWRQNPRQEKPTADELDTFEGCGEAGRDSEEYTSIYPI